MRRKITIPITTPIGGYSADRLLFQPVEIENAATTLGGNVKIISASLISKAGSCPSVDLVFLEEGGDILGAVEGNALTNPAVRAHLLTHHVCGVVTLDEVTDGDSGALGSTGLNPTYISTKSNVNLVASTSLGSTTVKSEDPLSTSLHVFGITQSAVASLSTTAFTLVLDIE